jgi:hypothetical protein
LAALLWTLGIFEFFFGFFVVEMRLAGRRIEFAVEFQEFTLLLGFLKSRLPSEHRANSFILIEETSSGLFKASNFPKQVSNIQLLADFFTGLINLPHFGPAGGSDTKGIEPVINGVANISQESKVFFLDFPASLIKGKSRL